MTLVEKLLKAEKEKAEELETKVITSKRLSKILGTEKPVEITIKEITAKRINELQGLLYDKKGRYDKGKLIDVYALMAVDGIAEPKLKDDALVKHFECGSPKDLALKLFQGELATIADKITDLSGLTKEEEEEQEEEIKN